MGLQLSRPLWEVLSNQTIMKQFVVLLAVCGGAFAKADADPYYAAGYAGGAGVLGYGGAIGIAAAPAVVAQRVATAPHCQTTYDTMLRPGGCATPGTLRLPVRSPTLSVCPSLGRCAPLLPSRFQGLPVPRSLSPSRPLSPTLLPLLSLPPLWLLSAMALASLVL